MEKTITELAMNYEAEHGPTIHEVMNRMAWRAAMKAVQKRRFYIWQRLRRTYSPSQLERVYRRLGC